MKKIRNVLQEATEKIIKKVYQDEAWVKKLSQGYRIGIDTLKENTDGSLSISIFLEKK